MNLKPIESAQSSFLKKLASVGSSFLAVVAVFSFQARVKAFEKISLKGSDTIGAKLMPQLIEAYKAAGSNVSFEIEDKGSSTAFTNLLNKTTHIGMSSRKIKDKEVEKFTSKGVKIVEHIAAIDMIAIVVNASNPVNDIEIEEVEGVFTGDVSNWSELGGKPGDVSAYTRNTSSGTYKSFQKLAMNMRDYGSKTQKMEGNEQIANEVANNKNGIGYIGLAYSKKKGLKKLKVSGVVAKPKNANKYAIARKLYYYTVGEPSGEVKKFLDWITKSEPAKKVIKNVGFIAP